jgi:glyoxylase-like metal-dependent hydrolase (beta-lactamase superfamily II)
MIHIESFVNRIFGSNTYVISNDGSNDIWLVDVGDTKSVIDHLPPNSAVRGVFLTHTHFDHIYGLNELLEYFPNTTVYTNEVGREALLDERKNMSFYHETPFVFEFSENIRIVNDGEEIELSEGLNAQVISTPGHHPSCLTYVVGDAIFTGDSYIPGTKVVTNLPKGNKKQAQESLDKIMQLLTKGLSVYPGHYIEENNVHIT